MISVALPLWTVNANTSSARFRPADEISKLTDSKVHLLLDDVFDTDGTGSAVGPIGRFCNCGSTNVRRLTALSASTTAVPGGCWQGHSLFRKSLLWSPGHGVTAHACNVGGVGKGIQDAEIDRPCCVVALDPATTAGSTNVVGP